MTLKEKLQQVQLLSDGQITDADAKAVTMYLGSLRAPAQSDAPTDKPDAPVEKPAS